jgi:hypothetical protein
MRRAALSDSANRSCASVVFAPTPLLTALMRRAALFDPSRPPAGEGKPPAGSKPAGITCPSQAPGNRSPSGRETRVAGRVRPMENGDELNRSWVKKIVLRASRTLGRKSGYRGAARLRPDCIEAPPHRRVHYRPPVSHSEPPCDDRHSMAAFTGVRLLPWPPRM